MKIASIFSSHMVLQRDRPVPIWGWSVAGDTVSIEFTGRKKEGVADCDGKWTVILDPMRVSVEPRELVLRSRNDAA